MSSKCPVRLATDRLASGQNTIALIAHGQRTRQIFLDRHGVSLFVMRQIDKAETTTTQYLVDLVFQQLIAYGQRVVGLCGHKED